MRLNIFSACWLGHEDLIRERDRHGKLHLVCPRCGYASQVLCGQPAGTPIPAPVITRRKLRKRKANVEPMRKVS